jgi:hypothetical protein
MSTGKRFGKIADGNARGAETFFAATTSSICGKASTNTSSPRVSSRTLGDKARNNSTRRDRVPGSGIYRDTRLCAPFDRPVRVLLSSQTPPQPVIGNPPLTSLLQALRGDTHRLTNLRREPTSIAPFIAPVIPIGTCRSACRTNAVYSTPLRRAAHCMLLWLLLSGLARGQSSSRYPETHDDTSDALASDADGSTSVPMDSWIYPALERLSSMGLIPSQMVAIRPWTRKECLRQFHEAEEAVVDLHEGDPRIPEADPVFRDLGLALEPTRSESQADREASLESVYARAGTIAGPAVTDSFHFGQTWSNDFGRPLARGTSAIAGYSGYATWKRYFLYDRQEAQQDPAVAGITASESALFFQLDDDAIPGKALNFYPPAPPGPAYLRQRPIELYAGVSFAGAALSFGKQELFWGPTTMGPWSFSSNAEPTYNLRLVTTRPHPIPFFPSIGTYRYDLVFGRLSGHHYPPRPYFNGIKFAVNFGDTLEMSVTRWSLLWGEGHPITFGSLWTNLTSLRSSGCPVNPDAYGDRCDPGDRKSDWDFRLHVPGLKQWLTVYADAYADDEPNPIDAPRRAAWQTGFYLARLAMARQFDLRVEMASSEELAGDEGGNRFFINEQYRDANTNKSFLLGNAVGRDARAFQYETTYWRSARTKLTAGLRQTKGSEFFLPGGSTITDGYMKGSSAIGEHWTANVFFQYERFLIPAMMSGVQHNVGGWLQMVWTPEIHITHACRP